MLQPDCTTITRNQRPWRTRTPWPIPPRRTARWPAVCARASGYRLEDWLAEILPEGHAAAAAADPVLQTLYDATVAALGRPDMDFDLLIPATRRRSRSAPRR